MTRGATRIRFTTWSHPNRTRQSLQRLRHELNHWLLATRDAGFLPEANVWSRLHNDTPWDIAQEEARYPLKKILQVAESVGDGDAVADQIRWLSDDDAAVRYWAAVGLNAAGSNAVEAREALLAAAQQDREPDVRIEAAAALASQGERDVACRVLRAELEGDRPDAVLHAMRTLQLIAAADDGLPAIDDLRAVVDRLHRRAQELEENETHPCWMFVRFSAEATLDSWNAQKD